MVDKKINFEKLTEAVVRVITLHNVAVQKFGAKEVFGILKKKASTGYNEMNAGILVDRMEYLADPAGMAPEQTAKLSLADFMVGIEMHRDVAPVVALAAHFGMACFAVPDTDTGLSDILHLLQDLNREYADGVNETLNAVQDRKITIDEAEQNVKELMDLINAAASLKAVYESIIDQGGK